MKNSIKIDDLGVKNPIFGNTHIEFAVFLVKVFPMFLRPSSCQVPIPNSGISTDPSTPLMLTASGGDGRNRWV